MLQALRLRTADSGIAIRLANETDVSHIVEIINGAFRSDYAFLASDRTSARELLQRIQAGVVFVALEGERIVGAVDVEMTSTSGSFAMLAVHPKFRRSGIGRALRETAEEYCRDHGCRDMQITTAATLAGLIASYERAGYEVVGAEQQPSHPQFSTTFAMVRMVKRF